MSDDFLLKALTVTDNILFADDDGPPLQKPKLPSDLASPEKSQNLLRNPRENPTLSTFRFVLPKTEIPNSEAMFNQRESPRHVRQSPSALKRSKTDSEPESSLQRYENAVLRYQKPKLRPKRQVSRDREQQQHHQQTHGYSTDSDESVIRNKSKSTSSIDTQSVNNILDEYEDLDYRMSSDLSDVGSISVTNFEAVMLDQQKKQQQYQDKSKQPNKITQSKSSPSKTTVLKVNQQTQVRQRSRDRQKDTTKRHMSPSDPTETHCRVSPNLESIDSPRTKVPEILLRKGEVQKRVDEWLNQAQSQNFREKPLTRSNSSAEQKRRYRQESRSRSIDEARPNGTSSSYDDLTSRVEKKMKEKVNVGVNTSRGSYKEYLAVKNKNKHQDYGFSASSSVIKSRDISPASTASRIPQRGPLGASFRSRRSEVSQSNEQTSSETTEATEQTNYELREKNLRRKPDDKIAVSIKTRVDSDNGQRSATVTTSIIPGRRPSFKRSQSHDQNASCQAAPRAAALVKEETTRTRGATKGPGSSLGDQGESILPNKEGESRRTALDSCVVRDKADDAACKSTESTPRCGPSARTAGEARSKEGAKMEHPRQESVYGAVGARVRAIQGGQSACELRSPKLRNLQNPRTVIEQLSTTACDKVESREPPRKPPLLPRKEQTVQEKSTKSPSSSPQSFKPNNRGYSVLNQLNEQNIAKSKVETAVVNRLHYTSPNHVEKIYERSLQPQVIHADDLESILRPSLQVSYERSRSDRKSCGKEIPFEEEQSEEEVYERVGELRYEHLETIEEDDQRSEVSEICKYPEIGLSHCLKVQQSLPNGRSRLTSEKRETSSVVDSTKTFGTFQSVNVQKSKTNVSRTPISTSDIKLCKEERSDRTNDENRSISPSFVTFQVSHQLEDSTEPPSVIHLERNSCPSNPVVSTDDLDSERQLAAKFKAEEDPRAQLSPDIKASNDCKLQSLPRSCSNSEDEKVDERGSVINEILVKNLQFKQDIPRQESMVVERSGDEQSEQISVSCVQKPINFHSVLSDDYENVQAQDARFKESKVYVTKEEMERQRLMELLRKGDFEAVKSVSENFLRYFGLISSTFYRKGFSFSVLNIIADHGISDYVRLGSTGYRGEAVLKQARNNLETKPSCFTD